MENGDYVLTDVSEFLIKLNLQTELKSVSKKWLKKFPFRVPLSYLDKIEPGNIDDPLLLQVFPSLLEDLEDQNFSRDPVQDRKSIISNGLLKKYDGRVLLLLGNSCPIHCRFCFRRHLKDLDCVVEWSSLVSALTVIKSDESIHEVILSGGEPLLASENILGPLVESLERICHIKRLRIHTRLPVVSPSSIKSYTLSIFHPERIATLFVIHINHSKEMDQQFLECIKNIQSRGITVLSQTVLLKGVNSSEGALADLFTNLVDINVLPYYLHQLDKVVGGTHFYTDEGVGQSLMEKIRRKLPGYAVPRYVKEVPALPYKQPIPS